MPALITHYLFGAEVVHDLPKELIATEAEVNAFLLGNQGPDPFLARHLAWPNHSLACNRLHRRMHAGHILTHFYPFAMVFLASRRATCQLVVRLHLAS